MKPSSRYTAIAVAAYAVLLLFLSGCASLDGSDPESRSQVPPDLGPVWDSLAAAEKAAAQTPDPADDAAVEAAWASLESEVAKRQAGPLAGLLPYGLGALALEAVGALGSRRKRKLYGSALRSITRGQVAVAAGDVLKAWGAQHSSPQPSPEPVPSPAS